MGNIEENFHVAQGVDSILSLDFASVVRCCSRYGQFLPDLIPSWSAVCSNDHNEDDAELYEVSDPIILHTLIRKGANFNMKHCLTGETPLHAAINTRKTVDFVVVFVRHGADVNSTNVKGHTPLHSAVRVGNPQMIANLINFGANINKLCSTGLSPLDFAVRDMAKGKLMIACALLKYSDKDPQTVIDLEPYKLQEGYEELNSYMLACQSEITIMKSIKLNEMSLLDFVMLVIDVKKPTIDLNADSYAISRILQAIQDHHLEVYKCVIIDGMSRESLIKELSRQYDYLPLSARDEKREVYLDVNSVYSIVEYLSKEEIVDFLLGLYFQGNTVDQSLFVQKNESLSIEDAALNPSVQENTLSSLTQENSLKTSTEVKTFSPSTKENTLNLTTGKDTVSISTKQNSLTTSEENSLSPSTAMETINPSTQKNTVSLSSQTNTLSPSQRNTLASSSEKNSLNYSTQRSTLNQSTMKYNLRSSIVRNNLSQSTNEYNLRSISVKNNLSLSTVKNNITPSFKRDVDNMYSHLENLTEEQREEMVENPRSRNMHRCESKAKRQKLSHP